MVKFVSGFNLFKGSIGSKDQLVQGFNLCNDSIGLRAQLVEFFKGFNSGKGTVDSRVLICSRVKELNYFN